MAIQGWWVVAEISKSLAAEGLDVLFAFHINKLDNKIFKNA
jgi:hypothetical protein